MSETNILNLVSEETFSEKMDNLALALATIGAGTGSANITSYKQIQQIVRMGLAPKFFSIGDQIVVERETGMTITSSNSSLSVAINEDTFLEKLGEAHTKDYEFIYDGFEWHLEDGTAEGEPVVLSTYGITCTGTPAQDNKIVVHETAAQIVFDIVAFDKDTPADSQFTHSMTLMSHYVTTTSFQFDAVELLHYCKTAMSAGTYNFTLIHGQYGGGTDNDGTYYFTTTKEIPIGGGWRIDGWGGWESSLNVLNKKISTYDASGNVLESGLIITSGTSGTSLGNYSARSADYTADELTYKNSIEKQGAGNNNYGRSAVRQYLNSEGIAGNWWRKQTVFDLANNYKAQAGFLHGLDKSFISSLGKVKVQCKTDSVFDGNATEYFCEDKFFIPSENQVRFSVYGDEKPDYPYWESLIPSKNNSANDFRIKYTKGGTSPQYWWTRSTYRGYGNRIYIVGITGAYSHNGAIDVNGLVPACCII